MTRVYQKVVKYQENRAGLNCIYTIYTYLYIYNIYCNVLITNETHNSYNQFLFHSFLSALHVSNESYHQEHGIIYCITQYNWYSRAGESSCYEVVRETLKSKQKTVE